MKNGFEFFSGPAIGEYQSPHFASLQGAIRSDELVAKGLSDGIHRPALRLGKLMSNGISI
jgi:hypothetical protein